MNEQEPVIIIGGGPAGMIAAIQLARYGLPPLLFEADRLGGLLWNANLVENYPGFPGGISGPDLVAAISQHFHQHPITLHQEEVLSLDYDGKSLIAQTAKAEYNSKSILIATGTRPNRFVDGLIPQSAAGRVHYEVGRLLHITDQHIAIVGAGDAAFDYALNLAEHNQVTILNRSDEIRALPLLVQRTVEHPVITYHEHTALAAVRMAGDEVVLSLKDPQGAREITCDHLIGAIGRSPVIPAFSARLEEHRDALVAKNRLLFAGDVHHGIFRQTAIAVGDGLQAAMTIYQFLKESV